MPNAELLYRFRETFDDGSIIEAVIWKLQTPVVGSTHLFKYRLFYGLPGMRIIGYDNERPKGDHRHVRGAELPYRFTSPEALIDDFLGDVAAERQLT